MILVLEALGDDSLIKSIDIINQCFPKLVSYCEEFRDIIKVNSTKSNDSEYYLYFDIDSLKNKHNLAENEMKDLDTTAYNKLYGDLEQEFGQQVYTFLDTKSNSENYFKFSSDFSLLCNDDISFNSLEEFIKSIIKEEQLELDEFNALNDCIENDNIIYDKVIKSSSNIDFNITEWFKTLSKEISLITNKIDSDLDNMIEIIDVFNETYNYIDENISEFINV